MKNVILMALLILGHNVYATDLLLTCEGSTSALMNGNSQDVEIKIKLIYSVERNLYFLDYEGPKHTLNNTKAGFLLTESVIDEQFVTSKTIKADFDFDVLADGDDYSVSAYDISLGYRFKFIVQGNNGYLVYSDGKPLALVADLDCK